MPTKTKLHTPRALDEQKTPQTIAAELKLPIETVLKHLAALNLDDLTAESPIEEGDYLPLLRAVRKRSQALKTEADEAQQARAEKVVDRHGARLMHKHPWIVSVGAVYSDEHRQFVIEISTKQRAKRLRGVPEKIAGVPIVLLYTGAITRAGA